MTHQTTEERLVRLEVQMEGLREQQKAHSIETRQLIEKLFDEVKELNAALNKGRGAFAFAMLVSGSIGAAIVKIISFITMRGN